MPYSADDVESLPEPVRALPAEKRRQWVAVFNEVLAQTGDEERAFASAYAAIKDKEEKQMAQATKFVYAPFVKVEEADGDSVYVYGKVADETVDLDKQITDLTWLAEALPEWHREWGNVREMHQPSAVGVSKALDAADDGFYLGAKIVDRDAVAKVREGVYKGYSIGIKGPVVVPDPVAKGGRIKGGKIVEVSIVDHPANENTKFVLAKAADIEAALAAQADIAKREWDTVYINDLPDSAFAYIEDGGEKDEEGKTVPRSLRHYPHHKADGSIDVPHLRNALTRAAQNPETGRKALPHLQAHAKELGIGEAGEKEEKVMTPTEEAELEECHSDVGEEMGNREEGRRASPMSKIIELAAAADLAKAGAEFSAKNRATLQRLHDALVEMVPDICKTSEAAKLDREAIIQSVKAEVAELVKESGSITTIEPLTEKVASLEKQVDKLAQEVEEIAKRAAPTGPHLGGPLLRRESEDGDKAATSMREKMEKLAASDKPEVRVGAQEWLRLHSRR